MYYACCCCDNCSRESRHKVCDHCALSLEDLVDLVYELEQPCPGWMDEHHGDRSPNALASALASLAIRCAVDPSLRSQNP
jgi:hypothetical protein